MTASACKLSIGKHNLSNRAFLAPMAGITDGPFRALAARFGAGLVTSEMIASAALTTGQRDMVRRLNMVGQMPHDLPHVVQLAGCEAHWLELGAKLAADAGADIIDINLGCPSKRVTNGYAGSALMRVPDLALQLIEAVIAATPLPVTVKMRLGWDDTSLNAAEIAKSAVDAGAQMIAVHGRTRQQFYKGQARWELVQAVVDAVDVPVVVNGDIINLDAARVALEQSGAAAVMIGRGAQGQPWMVGQIGAELAGRDAKPAPVGAELLAVIEEHYAGMLEEHGLEIGVRVARKHLGWYLDENVTHVDKGLRKQMLNTIEPQDVMKLMAELIADQDRVAA